MPEETAISLARSAKRKQFYREVGNRIKEARKKREITQEAIAESVGLSRTSLTNIESGRQNLLLHTFTEIASALGIPASELLPTRTSVLEDLGVRLPKSLPPEEREFIERTISPGEKNEHQSNSRKSRPDTEKKPDSQRSR